MSFDKETLQRIRDALPVSTVVGWYHKLRKQGAEMVAVDDPSLTVNDSKQIWKDFGSGGSEKAGDIFDFLERRHGFTFPAAVEECAKHTGVTLPGSTVRPAASPAADRPAEKKPAAERDGGGNKSASKEELPPGKNEVVATWDIKNPDNTVRYQTVRFQRRLPDGSWALNKNGKVWKQPSQRRASPDGDGTWIWALDVIDRKTDRPLEFLRWRKDGDWIRASDEHKARGGFELRTFESIGNVDHWLYNANDVAGEMQEPPDEQRIFFLAEGEGNVDVLKAWDLLAVSNTGGAGNFSAACAEFFRGAADVVILEDNDPPHPKTGKRAGTERTARIAPMLRERGCRVRVLNFKSVWLNCPDRGDVKDWRDQAGGTREALLDLVNKLSDWKPAPYKSQFGAVRWSERRNGIAKTYDWAIKGLVPHGKSVLIYGESQCGKSFEAFDMAMHVARGLPFAGRKCKQLGVVYCAAEKGEGFIPRMEAYGEHHGIADEEDVPFVVLTKPVDLWSEDATTDKMIDEALALSAGWNVPLGVYVLDTYQAATPGASIIKDEDVTTIYKRCQRIMERTGAGVWILHHKNAHGTIRGSLVLWNAIETTIEIEVLKVGTKPSDTQERLDEDKRPIRRATVRKQSEGVKGDHWDFVLRQVTLGVDVDGDNITSCVTDIPNQHPVEDVTKGGAAERPAGVYLSDINVAIFKAMLKAVDEDSIPPTPTMKLPASVTRVVKWTDVRIQYRRVTPREELGDTPERQNENFKSRVSRFRKDMSRAGVIGVDELASGDHVIWPTGKRVYGRGLQWPRVEKKKEEGPIVDQVTGETITDLDPGVF